MPTPLAKVTGSVERGTAGTFGSGGVDGPGDDGGLRVGDGSGRGSSVFGLRGPVRSPWTPTPASTSRTMPAAMRATSRRRVLGSVGAGLRPGRCTPGVYQGSWTVVDGRI